ncbi:hypothetical protein Tco_1037812, partial [Tanacetum coccineum]
MTTLAEFIIIAGADNRPPMLEKSLYDSWKSRMELYMENRENGRMILDSVLNGPLGLPPDVYAILNHHKVAKEICDRVKLLMHGTKLSLQEKECKLYDEFDKFSFVKGETMYQYYWRFAQLINNMNVINMSMRPVQVNTKNLNSLPPEWSKFMTYVKLARDLHTTNYDQLYSYLKQHEAHVNETRLIREQYQDPLTFVSNYNQPPSQLTNYHSQYNTTQFPQQTNTMIPQVHSPQSYSPMYQAPHLSQPQVNHSSIPPSQQYQSHMNLICLVVPVFAQGDDSITCLNKTAWLLCNKFKGGKDKVMLVLAIRVMLLVSGETIQEGIQGLLNAIIVKVKDTWLGNELNLRGQGMLHGLRTKQFWLKNRNPVKLDEEKLAFLADPGIPDGQAAQTTIPNNAAFQTEDLDAYDSNCDDVSNVKAVLMANLSNYGSDVISE